MRALSDLMTLVKLNLLTLLCCLPVVTAGAALASLHYCIMKMREDEEGYIASTFFREFKANLKEMTPIWLVILLLGVFFYFDMQMVGTGETGGQKAFVVLLYVGIFFVHGLCQWVFPLGAKFQNSFLAKARNSMLMVIAHFPRTAAMMAVSAIVPFILMNSLRLIPLAFCFGISLPAYLNSFLYYPVIKKQIEEKIGSTERSSLETGSLEEENEIE
ncbi:MAG: YesL family protein [Lachnospiraceae bacterium]|nr:YesL family protein [Lachnospiraceae bacterium]